jgi:5'-nucleotidase
MRFLVTNDDGYLAPGIGVLTRVAARLGDVDVVAPDREQSATSHSLTMHRPLRVRQVHEGTRVVDGTPTDCVVLALGELLERPPEFVLSGINLGSNLGDDVL